MSNDDAHAPVLLQYGPPLPPPSSSRRSVGRVLTVLACIFGPPAAAVVALFAQVTWTGCFIECSQPEGDHVTGGLLYLLALGIVLLAPVLAATLVRKAAWVAAAICVPVLEIAFLGLLAQSWA